jgi:hypothetical protein
MHPSEDGVVLTQERRGNPALSREALLEKLDCRIDEVLM